MYGGRCFVLAKMSEHSKKFVSVPEIILMNTTVDCREEDRLSGSLGQTRTHVYPCSIQSA